MSQTVEFDPDLEQMYDNYIFLNTRNDQEKAMAIAVLSDENYARRVKMPKWNMEVTMLKEPKVAIRYNTSWGISTSKEDNCQKAEYFKRLFDELQLTYDDLVKYACKVYGDRGPLISGIVHEHFPRYIKERLRFLAHAKGMAGEASRLHDYLSKTRSPMFR